MPVARAIVRTDYKINDETTEQGRARDDLHGDGPARERDRPSGYLVGDSFTVADLDRGGAVHAARCCPPSASTRRRAASSRAGATRRADARPGGQWVYEMFAEHRGTSAAVARRREEGLRARLRAGGSATNRCDSRSTSATAPSTSARSPSTPAVTLMSRAAAIDERRTISRAGSRRRSPALREIAADDHALRPEEVAGAPATASPRARPASAITRWQPWSPASASAIAWRSVRSSPCAAAQRFEHRLGAGERLEAAAVAAAAHRPGLVDRQVAELARRAGEAVVEPPAEDEAGTDAGRRLHVDDLARAAARAPHDLGQRAQVRVVLDPHRHAELLLHQLLRPRPDPAGQDRRVADLAGVAQQRTGQPHADAGHRPGARPELVEQPRHDRTGERRCPRRRPCPSAAAPPTPRGRCGRGRRRPPAGGSCRSRCRARRPAPASSASIRRPPSPDSSSHPSSRSSRAIDDTVAGRQARRADDVRLGHPAVRAQQPENALFVRSA